MSNKTVRPVVSRIFWEKIQQEWRDNINTYPSFPEYQTKLMEDGMDAERTNLGRFAAAFHDKEGHLKPKQKTLTIILNDHRERQLQAYSNGLYLANNADEIAATFVRVGLEA